MTDTDIRTMTDLNDSGTSTVTDVGVVPVDGQNMRLRIHVDIDGAVTYSHVNNAVAGAGALAEPGSVAAFSFDSGDKVIPYIYSSSDTAAADVLYLKDITVKKYPGTDAYATQV